MILQGDEEKACHIYYEFDRSSAPIGRVETGTVYKGRMVDSFTGAFRDVAIKEIQIEESCDEQSATIERAKSESTLRISHDNIVEMLGFVEVEENKFNISKQRFFVISEYLNGVTLDRVIDGEYDNYCGEEVKFASEIGQMYETDREGTTCYIMKNVLSAIMTLHDLGYVHHNIIPSNIMITDDGRIKMMASGISKQMESSDISTDIYALGLLLCQLCSGHPYGSLDQRNKTALFDFPIPIKELKNGGINRIIRKATNKRQSKRYVSVSEFRVDLERISFVEIDNNRKKIRYSILILISVVVLFAIITPFNSKINKGRKHPPAEQQSIQEPTVEEIYKNAVFLLSLKDDVYSQKQGKEALKQLADIYGYRPAKLKYYIIQINSSDYNDVFEGYDGLMKMSLVDTLDASAMYECGLTLSKSNRYFSIPQDRQTLLNIDADLEKANDFLYNSMAMDTSDYKSVYWTFNNLMEMKIENRLPDTEDVEIVRLFRLFEYRVELQDDSIAELYRDAIQSDKETLRIWGLIR